MGEQPHERCGEVDEDGGGKAFADEREDPDDDQADEERPFQGLGDSEWFTRSTP